jgi:hypothetical protein
MLERAQFSLSRAGVMAGLCALVFFIQSQIHYPNLKSVFALLIAGIGLGLILYFAFLQTTVNKGWNNLLVDAKLAVQIDRYPLYIPIKKSSQR